MKRAGIFLTLVFLLATAAGGDLNLNLSVGIRDEAGSEDRLPSLSLGADFGPTAWIIRPEAGLVVAFDPIYGASESELSLGIVHYWTRKKMRVHLGGGLSAVSYDFGANQGSTEGAYARLGAGWLITERFEVGFDLRQLWANSIEDHTSEIAIGYFQVSFLMGWRF